MAFMLDSKIGFIDGCVYDIHEELLIYNEPYYMLRVQCQELVICRVEFYSGMPFQRDYGGYYDYRTMTDSSEINSCDVEFNVIGQLFSSFPWDFVDDILFKDVIEFKFFVNTVIKLHNQNSEVFKRAQEKDRIPLYFSSVKYAAYLIFLEKYASWYRRMKSQDFNFKRYSIDHHKLTDIGFYSCTWNN